MIRIIPVSAILSVLFFCISCGGGGGGTSGQQSVLKVVNVTTNVDLLDVSIDQEMFFQGIVPGQASVFKQVLAGPRMVSIFDSANPDKLIELQNEFAFGIPYTILVCESDSVLMPVLAVNDRSDTPPAQFRIRAISTSAKAGSVDVRLLPGTPGRAAEAEIQASETELPASTVSSEEEQITPSSTATETEEPPVVISPLVIADNLKFRQTGEYLLAPAGDYQIVVDAGAKNAASTGVISFTGGQVVSVVVADGRQGINIIRLDDKP